MNSAKDDLVEKKDDLVDKADELIDKAKDATPDSASEAATQVTETARRNRLPLAIAAALIAAAVAAWVLKR